MGIRVKTKLIEEFRSLPIEEAYCLFKADVLRHINKTEDGIDVLINTYYQANKEVIFLLQDRIKKECKRGYKYYMAYDAINREDFFLRSIWGDYLN